MGSVLFRFAPLLMALFFFTTPLLAQNNLYNPEESALINAYASLGYYNWKMISTSDYMSLFGADKSAGLNYSHDAEPFLVKRYGLRSNFLIFSLGLDYFSDQFGVPSEFDSQQKLETDTDNTAKQLKILGGVNLGSVILQANIILREFNSTITSEGQRDYLNNILPIYYYPKNSDAQLLNPGDKASWYTKYKEYDIKINFPDPYFSFDLGVKYMDYEAPTEVKISQNGDSGDALIFTRNQIINVYMGLNSLSPLGYNFYLQLYMPLSFSIPGGYRMECDFVDQGETGFFSVSSLTASSTGSLSLNYITSFVKLQAGLDYGFYYSWVQLRDAKLKKNIQFWDNFGNTVVSANSGEKVTMSFTRLELFWGFFLSASVFF